MGSLIRCGDRDHPHVRSTRGRCPAMTEAIAVAGRLTEWQDRIRAAAAATTPLRIVGGGSKDFYGEPSTGERFETSGYRGVIDYDPAELVVTARCGTTLAELQQT